MMRGYAKRRGPRMAGRKGAKAQFNIRMDADLLAEYRAYCEEHGLDPARQVVNFIKRVVHAEYDFQEKLWQALTEGEGS